MSTKQPRRRPAPAPGIWKQICVQKDPDTVDRLAFKYMEMCKVDSSSDSESDASPRWSDASSKSFQVCPAPKRTILPQKTFGRYCPQPLDPYDGSSEDSASSGDVPKRQKHGGFRMKGRGRRAAPNPPPLLKEVKRVGPREETSLLYHSDVQMKSLSDSELNTFTIRAEEYANAGLPANPKPPLEFPAMVLDTQTTCQLMVGIIESAGLPGTLSKRKFYPLGDSEERTQRKKQCITTQMETDSIITEE
ncbi:uncharacterized protein LOC134325836 [Trichomycterus rosablanca]|uniref:uncharacterized protein LOC134325836 n=1 Tax=Trichomycterus rosablanca TaxID=2290929 RepID=UPI002F356DF4